MSLFIKPSSGNIPKLKTFFSHMRILVIEDDFLFFLKVKAMLEEMYEKDVKIIHRESASSGFEILKSVKPDIVLLDVILEDERSGIEFSKKLKDSNIPIIFMTAFRRLDLFNEAKKSLPFGYLQKPFDALTLKNTIDLSILHAENTSHQYNKVKGELVFKLDNGVYKKVELGKIQYVESFGNYCHFFTERDRYTSRMYLKKYAEILPNEFFIRVHRNYVVNINYFEHVSSLDKEITIGGKSIPLSRKYRADFLKMIKG